MLDELRAYLDWHQPLINRWASLTRRWPVDPDARQRWLATNYSHQAEFRNLLDRFATPGPDLSLSHRFLDQSVFRDEAGEISPAAYGRWLRAQSDVPAMMNGMLKDVHKLLGEVLSALDGDPPCDWIECTQADLLRANDLEPPRAGYAEKLMAEGVLKKLEQRRGYRIAVIFADPREHERVKTWLAKEREARGGRERRRSNS
jgi:hypothetical protein